MFHIDNDDSLLYRRKAKNQRGEEYDRAESAKDVEDAGKK